MCNKSWEESTFPRQKAGFLSAAALPTIYNLFSVSEFFPIHRVTFRDIFTIEKYAVNFLHEM
jgi:hypothetical protein